MSAQSIPDIADAPLTAYGVAVNAELNTPFQGTVATFTDADPGGTVSDYTATIDWGDGSPLDQGTISAQGSGFVVTGSHTYTQAGSPTITVQITDAGGATASTTSTVNAPPLDHLVLAPASATIVVGGSQAYTAEGFAANGADLGNVTPATTFTISPDGTCTGAICTPTRPGPHTVTGTDGTATGTATLNMAADQADLSLTMQAPSSVQEGATATYTVTVTNHGPAPATNERTSFVVPFGASVLSASASASTGPQPEPREDIGSGLVTWPAPTLAAGQTETAVIVVRVSAPAGSLLVSAAAAFSNTTDPTPRDNGALAVSTVLP